MSQLHLQNLNLPTSTLPQPLKHKNPMLAFSQRQIHSVLPSQARNLIYLRRRSLHASRLQVERQSRQERESLNTKSSPRTSSTEKTNPSSTNSSSNKKGKPLPPLNRPLGVRHRPSTLEITRAQR